MLQQKFEPKKQDKVFANETHWKRGNKKKHKKDKKK